MYVINMSNCNGRFNIPTHDFFFLSRKKYEGVCERVIVLDACYTIKRPTTMCVAKKERKKKRKKKK